MSDNKELQRRETVIAALENAKEKLGIYFQHSDHEYRGGVEHSHLIEQIDEAIRILK
jgi:hypothetical protein